MGVITDEARAWAGREYPSFRFQVSETDIQKYAQAIGEVDPVYLDPEAARHAGHSRLPAPPLFPYVIRMHASNLVPRQRLAPDGSATDDVPPLPATRAMAGETSIEIGVPVFAGDVITVHKRVVDMYEKEGRSGSLVFVVMEFEFINQDGAMVAVERFTRIYR